MRRDCDRVASGVFALVGLVVAAVQKRDQLSTIHKVRFVQSGSSSSAHHHANLCDGGEQSGGGFAGLMILQPVSVLTTM